MVRACMRAAHAANKPVGVCGEAASDLRFLQRFEPPAVSSRNDSGNRRFAIGLLAGKLEGGWRQLDQPEFGKHAQMRLDDAAPVCTESPRFAGPPFAVMRRKGDFRRTIARRLAMDYFLHSSLLRAGFARQRGPAISLPSTDLNRLIMNRGSRAC